MDLTLTDLHVRIAGKPVLQGLSLVVGRREIVGLIGAPGCGKSTILRAVFGLERVERGTVRFDGAEIANRTASANLTGGIAYVPQGGRVFRSLTVAENLRLAAITVPPADAGGRIAEIEALFPRLAERGRQLAGSLSGGERQMLALGMGLVPRPRLLLLDEPSTGLSPLMTEQMLAEVRRLADDRGISVLLVEQNVRNAAAISDRVLVMRRGAIGHAQAMAGPETVQALLDAYAFARDAA